MGQLGRNSPPPHLGVFLQHNPKEPPPDGVHGVVSTKKVGSPQELNVNRQFQLLAKMHQTTGYVGGNSEVSTLGMWGFKRRNSGYWLCTFTPD